MRPEATERGQGHGKATIVGEMMESSLGARNLSGHKEDADVKPFQAHENLRVLRAGK